MRRLWILGLLLAGAPFSLGAQPAPGADGAESESLVRSTAYQAFHDLISSTPTQGGLAVTRHSTGTTVANIDFDVNLGLTWVLMTVTGTGFHGFPGAREAFDPDAGAGVFLGLSGYYLSSYDFRMFDLYSQPVVSKLQNPQGEAFVEALGSDGTMAVHLAGGAAHESNGQFLGTTEDFATIRGIGNGTLYDQSFASMGWNYLYGRLAVHVADLDDDPGHPLYAFGEYRRFVPEWGIEDSVNITASPIAPGGIFAYDGLRLGVLYRTGPTSFGKVQVIAPSNGGQDDPLNRLPQIGLDYTHFFEVLALPCFVDVKVGPSSNPAWYFSYDATVAVGITVPTSFFANAVQDKFQAP
jgi:hypothetical protein